MSYRVPLAARALLMVGAAALLPLGVTAQEKQDVNEQIRALRKEIQELKAKLEKMQGSESHAIQWRSDDSESKPAKAESKKKKSKSKAEGEGEGFSVRIGKAGEDADSDEGSMVWHVQGTEGEQGEGGQGMRFLLQRGDHDGDEHEDEDEGGVSKGKTFRGMVLGHPDGTFTFQRDGKPIVIDTKKLHDHLMGAMKVEGKPLVIDTKQLHDHLMGAIEIEGKPLVIDTKQLHDHLMGVMKDGKLQMLKGAKVLRLGGGAKKVELREEEDGEENDDDDEQEEGTHAGALRALMQLRGLEGRSEEVKKLVETLHSRIVTPGKNGVIQIIESEDGENGEQPHVIRLRSKHEDGDAEEHEDDEDAPKPAKEPKRLKVRKATTVDTGKKIGIADQSEIAPIGVTAPALAVRKA